MKKTFLVLFAGMCLLPCLAFGQQAESKELERDPNASSGLKQIQRLMREVEGSFGEIPPDIYKIAVYQIRMSSRDFSPNVIKYIQGMIETTLHNTRRVKLISPPELKTITVVSTDTSFQLSNTIPSMEKLWELGDKLGIDAFLEGSCGKSRDGDVVLNLKLVKHRTSDIVWSKNFIIGPNKVEPNMYDLKWRLALPIRIFPVDDEQDGANLDDPMFTQIGLEGSVSEAFLENKRLWFSIHGGGGRMLLTTSNDTSLDVSSVFTMQIGVSALAVIFPKSNPDRGHWLGTYLSATYYIPFLFDGSQFAFTYGYSTQLSRYFGMRAGVTFIPGPKLLQGSSINSGTTYKLDRIAYEVDILNYTF